MLTEFIKERAAEQPAGLTISVEIGPGGFGSGGLSMIRIVAMTVFTQDPEQVVFNAQS